MDDGWCGSHDMDKICTYHVHEDWIGCGALMYVRFSI